MEKLFDIVHENPDLLVINKPAGLVCHPTKNGEMSSLIGRARLYLKNSEPRLVNRLDRETSGIVIVAKNSAIAAELGKILENRAIEKEYLAIVHGHVEAESGVIDAPLGKDEQSRVAVKDCVRPDGAPSRTEFQVERRFTRAVDSDFPSESELKRAAKSKFTMLRVHPRTGRKHQIRIHLAHVGHPIVGDKIYGGDEDLYLALVEDRLTAGQRQRLILRHHALHAAAARFAWRGETVEFRCAPEREFAEFCRGE